MKYLPILLLLFSTSFSWAEFEVDKHTLALWHFNEGQGNILYDMSGNKNHGQIFGAKWNNNGIFGGCLSFDGVDDFIEVTGSYQLVPRKKLTLEAWIKINAVSHRRFAIISKANNYLSENGYLWEIERDGKLKCYLSVTDWTFSKTIIPLNKWVYVAISFDGSKVRYYMDGEETDVFDASTETIAGNNFNLIISRTCNTYTYYFPGLIDEIRISDIARTSKEIKQHWLTAADKMRPLFTIFFNNDDRLTGEIIHPDTIVIDTKYGTLQVPLLDILSLDFEGDSIEDMVVTPTMRIIGKIENTLFRLKSNIGHFEIRKESITKIIH
ncbi:hypothetical protein AMJ52_05410 [candidate division TA06 bacterium DG_78]|uniref:LamG-like jellyroll fold domain-containing protein n=1 Tax=candidate division TA06 bacterium DG_78 TaxID=1703772 RepID=A0A0S7YD70_UNCT6|nr:MAG: hypothetical protein AMJ52_05410 [candidate division TA06 bacterium DG_78]